jgi:ubiquinone/menaquinone biosynthesis C-methylase UbiE
MQDKVKETDFFSAFSSDRDYDVFTSRGYKTLLREYSKMIPAPAGEKIRVMDLGCGTGAFTRRFKEFISSAYDFFGLDLSIPSLELAAKLAPGIHFCGGDIEQCGFKGESFDIVLFSGVLHHFADFSLCLQEGYRILKAGGCMLSYDPHRSNPLMWLYRHPSSPLFSSRGKTANERLLTGTEIRSALTEAGFTNVKTRCKSGITFKYVESGLARFLLPFYNLWDILWGLSPLGSRYGSFILGYGEKGSK